MFISESTNLLPFKREILWKMYNESKCFKDCILLDKIDDVGFKFNVMKHQNSIQVDTTKIFKAMMFCFNYLVKNKDNDEINNNDFFNPRQSIDICFSTLLKMELEVNKKLRKGCKFSIII